WVSPTAPTTYTEETRFKLALTIESEKAIKSVLVIIKKSEDVEPVGSIALTPGANEYNKMIVEKNIMLSDGVNLVEIVVENVDQAKLKSTREIRVGSSTLTDASKLDRTD